MFVCFLFLLGLDLTMWFWLAGNSLCRPGWHQIHGHLSVSASSVLGLMVCSTTSRIWCFSLIHAACLQTLGTQSAWWVMTSGSLNVVHPHPQIEIHHTVYGRQLLGGPNAPSFLLFMSLWHLLSWIVNERGGLCLMNRFRRKCGDVTSAIKFYRTVSCLAPWLYCYLGLSALKMQNTLLETLPART